MQWSKDIRRKDKKRSRKYYIDNEQLSNTNVTNNQRWTKVFMLKSRCHERTKAVIWLHAWSSVIQTFRDGYHSRDFNFTTRNPDSVVSLLEASFYQEPPAVEYRITWEKRTHYVGVAGMIQHKNGKFSM